MDDKHSPGLEKSGIILFHTFFDSGSAFERGGEKKRAAIPFLV